MDLLKEDLSPCLVGYCLMDNHVHLLVNAQLDELSFVIKKVNVKYKYAMQYNYHNQRVGHLFQNRYKSEAINTESYLIQVIRFITLLPAKTVNKGPCNRVRPQCTPKKIKYKKDLYEF